MFGQVMCMDQSRERKYWMDYNGSYIVLAKSMKLLNCIIMQFLIPSIIG